MSEEIAVWFDIAELVPWEQNPRNNDHVVAEIADSIRRFGWTNPILARTEDNMVIAGHTRLKAAKQLGMDRVPVRFLDVDPVNARLIAIADNKLGERAEWDDEMLAKVLSDFDVSELDGLGFELEELEELLADDPLENWDENGSETGSLVKQFGAPPFSVILSQQGYWMNRKREWLSLGIKSHVGREGFNKPTSSSLALDKAAKCNYEGGGSVFDPVICEMFYSWFNVPEGVILDPFAGGSVRGLVASALGYPYIGHELRHEQVDANVIQFEEVGRPRRWTCEPKWIVGDSRETIPQSSELVDLVFSCPPYADLEVYSDEPGDISNMKYDDFLAAYREIIKHSCDRLKDDRFAIFVIGEVRDKKGAYYNFLGHTIQAFIDAGMTYYNEIVYVLPNGTLSLRAGPIFKKSRKIGKLHQNILIFFKGEADEAKHTFQHIPINLIEITDDNDTKD